MATKSRRRVYIDSCPFIDGAKHELSRPVETDVVREVGFLKLILEAHEAGEVEAFTSVLTIAECLHVEQQVTPEVRSLFERLLTSGKFVSLVGIDPFVAIKARALRWDDGITVRGKSNPRDYLHLACALQAKCHEFITTDGGILGQATPLERKGIRVLKPSQTLSLSDERRQLFLLPRAQPKGTLISLAKVKRRPKSNG